MKHYKVGAVFKFAIDNKNYGYGQIVAAPPDDLKYFAIFETSATEEVDLQTVTLSKILILTQSMDIKFRTGDWKIVGNRPILRPLPFPEYKVFLPSGWIVENHERQVLRIASDNDLQNLTTRKSFSPDAIEYAVRAYYGLAMWKDFCDDLIITS